MEKTLFIHIGEPKAATSSIQTFLFKNQELLRKKGILYPGFITDHHKISTEILNNTLSQIQNNKKSPAKKFIAKMMNSQYSTYILSSENFCRLWDNASRLKALIPYDINVKIIYYIRRQDDQAEAIYNQIVKGPIGKHTFKIDEFLEIHCHRLMDYEKVLAPWEEAFGRENIIVRCFEEGQLKEDIFTDFLDAIGLEMNDDYKIPQKRINPSLDWDVIELIRVCKINFKDDIKFHTFLQEYFEENNEPDPKRKHILSPEKRRNIIKHFEESNKNVAEKYLGRKDGRLFYAPLPDLNEPYAADANTNNQNISPAIQRIMYEFYKQNDSGIRKLLKKFKKARDRYSWFEILKILYYKYITY